MESARTVAEKGQQLLHGPMCVCVCFCACIAGSSPCASIHLLSFLDLHPLLSGHDSSDTHTHTLFTHHWLEELMVSGERGVGQTKWKQARLIIYIRVGHRPTEERCVLNSSVTSHVLVSDTT